MSNIADFLKDNNITPEQVVEVSKTVEHLNSDDRDKRVARESARRNKRSYEDASAAKPSALGRGATMRAMNLALKGEPLTRTSRKKITRAVNSILQSQKKDVVEWRALFADVGARKGKSVGKAKKR